LRRAADGRWATPLARWIGRHGAHRVARDLGLTDQAIYGWISGRTRPRLAHAIALSHLSRLSIEDVIEDRLS